jgi:hypothetical protein
MLKYVNKIQEERTLQSYIIFGHSIWTILAMGALLVYGIINIIALFHLMSYLNHRKSTLKGAIYFEILGGGKYITVINLAYLIITIPAIIIVSVLYFISKLLNSRIATISEETRRKMK